MTKRNSNLDLIKCIACFAVVGLHAVGMNNYTWYYLCGCGVPLFFMVNGYLMFSNEKITYSYAFRKILQIVKIVFLWNLLIAVPVLLLRQKLVNPFTLSFQSLLQKGYLWHFWFFGALMLIYLALPLMHRLLKKKLIFHIITWALLLCICLTMSILSMTKGYPLHAYVPQSLRLWTWLFFFVSGGLAAYLLPKLQRFYPAVHTVLLIAAALVNNRSLKHVGLYLTQSRIADYYYDYLSSVIYYILLFTLLMRLPIQEKMAKGISAFSSLTMGIFIVHPVLLTGINAFFTPSGDMTVFLFWMGLTAVSALIALVMSKIPLIRELIKL